MDQSIEAALKDAYERGWAEAKVESAHVLLALAGLYASLQPGHADQFHAAAAADLRQSLRVVR